MRNILIPLFLLIFCNQTIIHAQIDSTEENNIPENIVTASQQAKNLLINLNDKTQVDLALKKIHTYKYVESITLEGKTDDITLKKLFYRLSNLKNLSHLRLMDNDLRTAPDNFNALKSLKSVTIEDNLEFDYDDLFLKLGKTNIRELNLLDNNLKGKLKNISRISSLTKLKITGSDQINYEQLIDTLTLLPRLNHLSIPVNFITDLPRNIVKLSSLQILDVSDNILSDLPDDMSSLKVLNNLSIHGNLFLNPVQELEKFKGNDIRYISMDKEISGEDIEKLKTVFPNAEISFPLINEKEDNDEDLNLGSNAMEIPPFANNLFRGELKVKKDFKILSTAYQAYPTIFRSLSYDFDTLGFNERYSNLNYTNIFRNQLTAGIKLEKRNRNRGKLKEIWFHLPNSYSTRQDYPELNAFAGMYWIYKGDLKKRKFKKNFINPTWNDIRLLMDKNTNLFNVQLKSAQGFQEFKAYPVVSKKMSLEKSQETYLRRHSLYRKALIKRVQKFDKKFVKDKMDYDKDFKKLQDFAWKELQLRMSDKEKIMPREEWLQYYDNIITNEEKAINEAPLLLDYVNRGLILRKYNWQSDISLIAADYGAKNITAYFIDEKEGGTLAIKNLVIVDKRLKSFSTTSADLGLSAIPISLKQFSSYMIFVELRNGNIGIISSEEIDRQAMESNQNYSLKVKVLDKNLETIGNFFKMAEID